MLDTNVWLDLLVFRDGRLSALADALSTQRLGAAVTAPMREEFARVLHYPVLALDAAARDAACDAFDALATPMHAPVVNGDAPRCGDPDDQMFVDLALAIGAPALLTRDDALLRLRARLRPRGVEVMTPLAWCEAAAGQIPKR